MLDTRVGGDDEFDEIRLPWLEPIEEDELRGPSLLAILTPILIGLAILALVIGGAYWMWTRAAAPARPQLVEAAKGDRKAAEPVTPAPQAAAPAPPAPVPEAAAPAPEAVAPALPAPAPEAAMPTLPSQVAAQPVEAAPPPPRAAPRHAPAARITHHAATRHPHAARRVHKTVAHPPPTRRPAPASRPAPRSVTALALGAKTIQLGAYDSLPVARWVWKSMSTRYGYLKPLAPSITPVRVNGRKYYRLRATGLKAHLLCAWLRQARETCFVVD